MPDLKRNINKVYSNKEPFWGKYVELNNATVPSLSDIQEYQLNKINSFQKIASEEVAKKNATINALFTSGSINTLSSQYTEDGEYALDKALTNIVGILNGTYKSNISGARTEYDYQLLQKTLKSLEQTLILLNSVIVENNGDGIPSKYIDTLRNTIAACNMSSLDPSTISDWFKHLNKFKGDLVEDIGVAWLSAKHIPDITTINTGAINYQGSGAFGRKGQLIQDLMSLSVSKVNLDSIPIEYRTPNGDKITTSLKNFFIAMEAASNSHKQIVLEDNGYKTLLQLSALNIQAKSGLNQKPWNETKSTQVSIGEFSDEAGGLGLSARRTFELLHELDQDNNPQKDIWVADSSKDYNYLADYGLATVLFKVLHLETTGNNYLLTPQGFTTFTDRIKYLMEKRRSRVYIKNGVTINDNTLGTPYNVGMTNYN